MPRKNRITALRSLRLQSPSKLNLYLRILGKRADGFHELVTVFERISLSDAIGLRDNALGAIKITSSDSSLPRGPKNLAWKAAELLKKNFAPTRGVFIHIQKNIPIKAGLGGGSSNAATVLVGLNKLWRLDLSTKQLLKLGATLGSDVAFFILGESFALGSGRGEILKPIRAPKTTFWHCLVKPRTGISTALAYKCLPATSLTPLGADARMLVHSIVKSDFNGLSENLYNSLELSQITGLRTILKNKNKLLKLGASGALMSGSGSCLFGIFSSKKMAQKAAAVLKKNNKSLKVFVVSTL